MESSEKKKKTLNKTSIRRKKKKERKKRERKIFVEKFWKKEIYKENCKVGKKNRKKERNK